jgi:hypothetical protein
MYIGKGKHMKLKSNHETSFTSIHIFKDKYTSFKEVGISSGMTLQKLVNRCVYLYTNDAEFKKKIDETNALQISGSAF